MNWSFFIPSSLQSKPSKKAVNLEQRRRGLQEIHMIISLSPDIVVPGERGKFMKQSPGNWSDEKVNQVFEQLKKVCQNDIPRKI